MIRSANGQRRRLWKVIQDTEDGPKILRIYVARYKWQLRKALKRDYSETRQDLRCELAADEEVVV